MKKYIRTDKGIWETSKLDKDELEWLSSFANKQSNNIEDLIDYFICISTKGGRSIRAAIPHVKEFIKTNEIYKNPISEGIYGAILTNTGKQSSPVLHSVAKMNKKGKWELL